MWKNKDIKKRAKISLKANYWILVLLCFLMIFLGISNSAGESFSSLKTSDADEGIIGQIMQNENLTASSQNASEKSSLKDYLVSLLSGDSDKATDNIAKSVIDGFRDKTGFLYKIGEVFCKFVFSNRALGKVVAVLYGILVIAIFLFLKNPLIIGFNRVMIESHTYGKSRLGRVFFIFRSQGYWNAVWVYFLSRIVIYAMIIVSCIPLLIGLFVKGGMIGIGILCALAGFVLAIIESVRLYWVGYILACDPKIQLKKAFRLSYSMTKGSFWHQVGFFLSFLPWHLLSILTLGLLDIFFLTPYKGLAYGELFLTLRQHAIDHNAPYANRINGIMMGTPHPYLIDEYQEAWAALDEKKRQKLEKKWAPLIAKGCYPVCYPDLNPAHQNALGKIMMDHDPMRKYTILNLILMFFIFAFIGWAWEVMLHIFKDGMFINRGTMHGPWLPIYGFGGVMIIVFLRRFAKKPALLMASTFVLCGIVEYVAHWYLELTKGIKWWDYSNHFINLNGRICLEGLLVFSIAGLLFVYIAGPALDNLLKKIPKLPRIIAAIILILLFAGDMVYSHNHPNTGKGITDYGDKKAELNDVSFSYGKTDGN